MIASKLMNFTVEEYFIVFDHGYDLISNMALLSEENYLGKSCILVHDDQGVLLSAY